jgi:protein-L-isoaspartate(D-aspartate) O-methyltransferase
MARTLLTLLTLTVAGAQADPSRPARAKMIDEQIRARGVRNEAVLDAMRKVPRHRFVPAEFQGAAYDDSPLPIGHGQTISQPYIVAYMTDALGVKPGEKVLEIGTGSGYQAAVLAEIASEVYTIEIVPELGERARKTLTDLGYKNVFVRVGNGYAGWPEKAPFPRIIVTAAPDDIPPALVEQLAPGGTMVLPVGTSFQEMTIVTKTPQGIARKTTIPVRFVPMVGKPKR